MDVDDSISDAENMERAAPSNPQELHHLRRKQIINRLSRVEGHIRAIKRMEEEGRSCPDILVQLAAVRSAVDEAARLVLENHMELCLWQAAGKSNPEDLWKEAKMGLDMFLGSRHFH